MQKNKFDNLKIGIVGCGNIASIHLNYIAKLVHQDNIALYDIDENRLTDFAKIHNINHCFTNLSDLISQFTPHVIHIVTPPASHKALALSCLENKIHVLIEKPMCMSISEADEIIAAAKKYDRLVCVDHMRLYDPLIISAQNMISSGKFGELVNITSAYSYDYFQRLGTDPTIRWMSKIPGGVFFDVMPHPLCIINKFLPDIKITGSACLRDNHSMPTELSCSLQSSTATAALQMSLTTQPLRNSVVFHCQRGSIKVDHRNFLLIKRKASNLPNAIERVVGNLSSATQMLTGTISNVFKFIFGKLDSFSGLNTIISEFYTAVTVNGQSPVPAEEAKRLLQLSESILTSKKDLIVKQLDTLTDVDVLVTGATGLIGRPLVESLLNKNLRVRILTHRQEDHEKIQALFSKEVNIIRGDIYDYDIVKHACQGITTVYHLAAAMSGSWANHLDTTITGTHNILKASGESSVDHLIYVSTLNVYDATNYPNNEMIDETFPFETAPDKRGAYSRAKHKAEETVRTYMNQSDMHISIFRPGLVYNDQPTLPKDVGIRLGKKVLLMLGNGQRKLPLTYVGNLVHALTLAYGNKFNDIYNVVDPDYLTQKEFVNYYQITTHEKLIQIPIPMWLFSISFASLDKLIKIMLNKNTYLKYKLNCIKKCPTHSVSKLEHKLNWTPKVTPQKIAKQKHRTF